MFNLLTLVSLSAANASVRCQELIPNESNWYFAHLITNSSLPPNTKFSQMFQACKTLDPNSFFWRGVNDLENVWYLKPIIRVNNIRDIFTTLANSELENKYMAELLEIKKNDSPLERVQQTYETFLKYKKSFHLETFNQAVKGESSDRKLIFTPAETLANGGVCRDFARLLKYSLDIVAAPISETWQPVITSRIETAFNPMITLGHMWVSAQIPTFDKSGAIAGFERIDLDPTNFDLNFAPLPKLNQNYDKGDLATRHNQCLAIQNCLQNNK